MNQYVIGAVIKALREKNKMTQMQLAQIIGVTDKTVSKWETGKGFPDITLLEPIADIFSISVNELISGNTVSNTNVAANMLRCKFYICPVCGNIMYSMGEAIVNCHGVTIYSLDLEKTDEYHNVLIKKEGYDYYVKIEHDMSKKHYISFIAALSYDKVQLVKLYPEGSAEGRFYIDRIKKIYFYCNKDGLFEVEV